MFNIFNLSLILAKAEFKLKNEGSYLGILWYLLNPLFMFAILLAVFSGRLGAEIEYYSLYLLLGIIMFNFFQQATVESTRVINDNKWIIKSVYFSYESLIVSIVFKTILSHLFEILLFAGFLIFYDVSMTSLLFYPIILIIFSFFVAGISFILSTLTVFFVDLNNIWNFAVHLIWLGTPIFYTIENQINMLIFNSFNPLYYFITLARDLIIYSKTPEWWLVVGALSYAAMFFLIGMLFFNKFKHKFAELI